MDGFAFTRPDGGRLPLSRPAFWWQGAGGARILAYRSPAGWYGTERDELPRRLDDALRQAEMGGLTHLGVFFGVGNHGGGPTRRQIADVRTCAVSHPDIQVVFSGLHRLFDALREEVASKDEDFLPVHTGELGFCLRGCYSSAAKIKFAFRQTQARVSRAETTDAAIASALGQPPADLSGPWDAVLLNSFHDILPGTSIARAFDQQIDGMGGARHDAGQAEFAALNALASKVDTSVPPVSGDRPTAVPFLMWNPHPFPVDGLLELEACLDLRPLFSYTGPVEEVLLEVRGPDGEPVAFQRVGTENHFMISLAWRVRVLIHAALPPLGWAVYTVGWVETPGNAASETGASSPTPNTIASETYSVAAHVEDPGIQILRQGVPVFGEEGLSIVTVEDPYGVWGDMNETPESLDLSRVRVRWAVTHLKVLEAGPQRSKLWVRMAGGVSCLDLTFSLAHGREDIDARLLWNERAARLKLVMPVGAQTAEFDVPGGSVVRGPLGEVPGGRWVRTDGFGFASDSLYGFDLKNGTLRATVCRATRYAADAACGPEDELWHPPLDSGELKFQFLLTAGGVELETLARQMEQPPVILPVPASEGEWPRLGSLASLSPLSLSLLACKPAEDGNGLVVRVQGGTIETNVLFSWPGQTIPLGPAAARAILTWRVTHNSDGWQAQPVNAVEVYPG